jgi:uncharacterized protein (TIGR02145 family)
MKRIFFISIVLILSTNILVARVYSIPTFGNIGAINLCVNGSYYLNPSTTIGTFSSNDPLIATVNSSGYVTGVKVGTAIVSFVTNGGSATVSATINVVASLSPSLSITDPLAKASYNFNNNPQGPMGGLNNYVGYNGYNYSSQVRPSNTGFFRASNQSDNAAGCPYEYYIFRCTTCGTVPEYATRPQGTLSGSNIGSGSTGKLTYTSSNGGGPFTIVYLPAGGFNVTVSNISSTVAFNVASGTPTSTKSYTLKSVTDQITNSSSDFSEITAIITVGITIGSQVWMGKNLDVTNYRNGDPILQVVNPSDWAGLTTGAWCYFNNDPVNGTIYGKLYNWYAVNDTRGLAPSGWHIPTDIEWTTLGNILGANPGAKMKSIGTANWTSPNTGATNSSGFTALPGGVRNSSGIFSFVGSFGNWWSSNEMTSTTNAWYRNLIYNNSLLGRSYGSKKLGYSVRLIKD